MSHNFGDRVIDFNSKLDFSGELPEGFRVINPFIDNPETIKVMKQFYQKFYADTDQRKFIVGINPSRHGAGVTGVPFTDTKRLESFCEIKMESAHTHEISSVFMYTMIQEFGGVKEFYKQFYINSPFPLAIVQKNKSGKWINANYYDDVALFEKVKDFMILTLENHISLGLDTSEIYVLGKKNAVFLQKINRKANLFKSLKVLEHPRYIQQYKSRELQLYIDKYIITLNKTP